LEGVLFAPDAARWPEILHKWKIPFNQFLDFAVTMNSVMPSATKYDETKAERYAERLERKRPVCDRRRSHPELN